jgi:hypothetical protein
MRRIEDLVELYVGGATDPFTDMVRALRKACAKDEPLLFNNFRACPLVYLCLPVKYMQWARCATAFCASLHSGVRSLTSSARPASLSSPPSSPQRGICIFPSSLCSQYAIAVSLPRKPVRSFISRAMQCPMSSHPLPKMPRILFAAL